ncbi:MAG: hypothetical protein AAFO63_01505 [Pseudomonadota bacterium]
MKLKILTFSACLMVSILPASADSEAPVWSLSASGSWSEVADADQDATSASVSLSRQVGDGSIGVSLAGSGGSGSPFDTFETTDQSNAFGSVWVYWPVGLVDLSVGVTLGQETFDGRAEIQDTRFGAFDGATAELESDVDSLSFDASVSRTFFRGQWDIIPSASLGWSQSETQTKASTIGNVADSISVENEETGWTATLGIGVGYLLGERTYLFSDLVGVYAENGASSGIATPSRLGGLRTTSRQEAASVNWADISGGASFDLTDAVTLSVSGGTTVGRDEEEIFATTSLSLGF